MRRRTSLFLASLLAFAALHGGACELTPMMDPTLADVVFEGQASPVALDALLAASPAQVDGKGVIIDEPANNSVLPTDAPPTFSWHLLGATSSLRAPAPKLAPMRLLPSTPSAPPAWLRDLLGPERAARADEFAVMSGAGYYLLFSTDASPQLLRVFTTKTSYTPDAKAWATLQGAMIWTKLTIVSASFTDDALAAGAAPLVGQSILFCAE